MRPGDPASAGSPAGNAEPGAPASGSPRSEAGAREGRAERLLVVLIALHTVLVGFLLAFLPRFAARFAGWGEVGPLFFLRQAGVFHFLLAFGYLLEHFRYRGVLLLLAAKAGAAVFLLSAWAWSDVPWAVPFSGVTDGLMGAAAWAAHRRAVHARDPRGRVG